MDANTPDKESAAAGSPIQDEVGEPSAQGSAVRGPEAQGPEVTRSAVKGPAVKGPAVKGSAVKGPVAERPARPTGPNASAIVLGLLAMIFGGLAIARETLGWHVDWSRLGPGGIIGIGVLMVVIGAVGLVRRHDDV